MFNFMLIFIGLFFFQGGPYQPQNGDIIFQTSLSAQSEAIQRATGSKYSHMGIVYVLDGEPFVFEAVSRVRSTPLKEWIKRGKGGHYVVKRLNDAEATLTREVTRSMLEIGRGFEGKHYDLKFQWSDDQMYCSELVWKIFKRALNVEIGHLETVGDFDLSDSVVRKKVSERFGKALRIDEPVVSPAAMFASRQLKTVFEQ